MKRPKPPKKTDTLEVRVPHGVKQAFLAKARSHGRTGSAVMREFVESYLADATFTETRPMLKRLARPLAATSIAASVVALYAITPTAVAAAPDLRAIFADLDRDGDGLLSVAEFVDRNGERLGPVDASYVRAAMRVGDDSRPYPALVRKAGAAELRSGTMTAEVEADLRGPFRAQDGDGNGLVSFGEFKRHHLAILREGFDALDTDYSGAIERAEYGTGTRQVPRGGVASTMPFESADLDGDERLSWSEFLG